jgi:hypothetical protein
MLALAGALYAIAFSQGPPLHQDNDRLKMRPTEHRELIGRQFRDELFGAIELYEELTFKVIDAEYDGVFEPLVEGFVEKVGDKTRLLLGQPLGRELTKFLVNQRQKLLGGVWVTLLNGGQKLPAYSFRTANWDLSRSSTRMWNDDPVESG